MASPWLKKHLGTNPFPLFNFRELRAEGPCRQPAERAAAPSQEPGGGHGGVSAEHHPRDHHRQPRERPCAHTGARRAETGLHQQVQVPLTLGMKIPGACGVLLAPATLAYLLHAKFSR